MENPSRRRPWYWRGEGPSARTFTLEFLLLVHQAGLCALAAGGLGYLVDVYTWPSWLAFWPPLAFFLLGSCLVFWQGKKLIARTGR